MKKKKKIKLRKQLNDQLRRMYLANDDHFRSKSALNVCRKEASNFVDYCYANDIRDKENAFKIVSEYLYSLVGKYDRRVINVKAYALAKTFCCSIDDFGFMYPDTKGLL